MQKNDKFYKELGNSVKDIRNYKGEKAKDTFFDKVKRPFKLITSNKKLSKKEKTDLLELMMVILTSILGVSVIGFLIARSFKKRNEDIEKFKRDFHQVPNVEGKGREMYTRAFETTGVIRPKEEIIKVAFPPGFGKDRPIGIGYSPDHIPSIQQDTGYPNKKQKDLLKKLGLQPKWFTKSS